MAGEITNMLKAALPGSAVSDAAGDLDAFKISNPIVQIGSGPVAAVKPADAGALQKLVALANDKGLGLVPVSSAGPHLKGGTSCGREHIAVDLAGWKKISNIDRRNRVCTIEPGVTFGELLDALEPHGMTLSTPLSPRSGKSVLAAFMDREPGTWPKAQWDISDPVGSTEFVFGSGEIFRTGSAGGPGTLEQQRAVGGAQKSSMGPSQTDFHRVVQGAQGSMGIVTWMTVRTEVKPTIEEPRIIASDDIAKIAGYVYEVQRPWLGEHSFILDNFAAAMLMTRENPSAHEATTRSIPRYVCLQNIAGFLRMPKERVEYQLQDIGDIAKNNGLELMQSAGEIKARDLLKAATRPCGPRDWRHALRGHCLSVFFLSTLDRAPKFISVMDRIAAKHSIVYGTYLQPVVQNHGCHFEFMMPFNPEDSAAVELMRAVEKEAVAGLSEAGAFFSRPYGSATGITFEKNALNTEMLKKVKKIFDPNGTLSPGRFGL